MTTSQRRTAFRDLHRAGCFALPNPWDGGSAVRFARAGFKALASTSAGAAWALGKEDGEMTVEEVLEHLRFLCGVTELPVNADFEAGFADTAEGVADNVARCIATGVAGLSIEDAVRGELIPVAVAAERIRAARGAIDRSGEDVVLVGRCEAYFMEPLDLGEVIARLRAYGEAGADCLYAPGLKEIGAIAEVVRSVDRPVNANLTGTGLSVADMAAVGVRRVSVGGALARASYAHVDSLVALLATEGRLP
ncbi:isocitrate lyase/PEP mutase family protein [Aureimonas glaciei]|uniref:2-methylisocitrate lyase n=1 Tax=Aureimonas glaciei TaxID=1776957 RepID=A0A916XUC1_9HYPH|nr:isocitrate lyase/phosphoenolpyruvate mutase family protein [Aureimonas glaciei]GGD11612.1 2-methylisocitrate lyase [Aureimonas glaciei]